MLLRNQLMLTEGMRSDGVIYYLQNQISFRPRHFDERSKDEPFIRH